MQKFPVLLCQQKVIDVKRLIYWQFKNVSFTVVEFESIRCCKVPKHFPSLT